MSYAVKYVTLSRNVEYFLKEKELHGNQLAKIIGVDPKTITRYRNGKSMPKTETLVKMAECFGCSAEGLVKIDYSKGSKPEQPSSTAVEYSHFEEMKLYLYYLREGTTNEVYDGWIELDKHYDKKRIYLHGTASTGHDYDVKLVIEGKDSVFIFGRGKGRRFHIALHYPDFRDAPKYTGGVGILTRLDSQQTFVGLRVVLTADKIDLKNEETKKQLLKVLSDKERYPRVWVNARINDEFRSGKWLEEE